MAQIFWEQIRNELPGVGEFLTGSLNVSGSFSTKGSLTIDLINSNDVFNVKVNGEEKIKVGETGVLQLSPLTATPTAVQGGIYYSGSNEFFIGFL